MIDFRRAKFAAIPRIQGIVAVMPKGVLAALILLLAGTAGDAGAGEKVTFPGAKAEGYAHVETVSAELRMPKDAKGKVPAVIILHGSGGIDGRGLFYAEALNEAGFATLEVFMFARGQRPRQGGRATMTHGFGALKYLAGRPDVDSGKISAMGFSFGANLTFRLAVKDANDAFLPNAAGPRFAAHASFYPSCWVFKGAGGNAAFTGAPVLLFSGGRDDYETSPDSCKELIDALPESTRRHMALQFYPDATHAWDTRRSEPFSINDPYAFGGRGGSVRIKPDPVIAEDSRRRVVEFFVRVLTLARN